MRRSLLLLASLPLAACGGATPPPGVPPVTTAQPAPLSSTATQTAAAPGATPPVDRDFPRLMAETNRFNFGSPRRVHLAPDGKSVLFLRSGPRDALQSLYEMDVASGAVRELLDAAKLLGQDEQLSPQERARRERQRLLARGFATFELSKDGTLVLLPLSGRLFVYARASGKTKELPTGEGAAIDPHFSDDGKWVAYVRQNDVHVVGVDGGSEIAVTRGGTDAKTHGLAEFIAQEELDRARGFWLSPDAAKIVYEEADTSKVELLTIADPAHPEHAPDRVPYPRPGKANADVRLGIAARGGGATTWIEWDRARFPYVGTATWEKNAPLTVYVLDRLQKNGQLLAVDAATGATHVILEEHDDAWVNLDPTVPKWLPDGKSFLWSTESHGAWQLEQRDAKGALVRVVMPPELGYQGLVDVDESGQTAIVDGAPEPTEMAVWVAPLASAGAPKRVLGGAGDFDVAASYAARRFVAIEQSLTADVTFAVRSLDDGARQEIPRTSERAALRNVELAQVGPDHVRVAIVRPRGFVRGEKYPVIDSAYAGPHVNLVEATARAYREEQWMADMTGAIVVEMDTKGTPRRGRDWERALAGKLAEVPLDGHVATLDALGKAYPEMDTTRIGVYGWSFGGFFSALAVLARPDVYKVAFAAAPPADWRDYDTCYTERYLGLPDANAAAYDASSLLTAAAAKKEPARPLLLLHGTADDNVFFLNSLKLVDALERTQRPFVFTPIVGATHRVVDPDMNEDLWVRAAEHLKRGL